MECGCRHNLSPNAEKPGHQIGVVSFQFAGRFYYLVLIEGGSRDALSFRGISAKFSDTGFESKVLNFHIKGPLLEMATDLSDFDTIQIGAPAIEVGGGKRRDQRERARLFHTLAPCDGISPHGALLRLQQNVSPQKAIEITLSHFREGKKGPPVVAVIMAITSLLQSVDSILQDVDSILRDGAKAQFTMTTQKANETIVLEGRVHVAPGPVTESSAGWILTRLWVGGFTGLLKR